MQKLFRSLIAIGGLAGLVACGDDVSITPPPPPDLVISGAPVTAIQVGAKVQLSANQAVTWSTSAANVATVDGTGLVTAVAAGVASITATSTADANQKASVTITVTALVNATISVQNITKTGTAGETVNNNNVAGSIDVNLNVVPGDQVVQRVEVLIDGNVACTQNLSGAQAAVSAEADVEVPDAVIVSCQINTAAFSATTGVASYFNGSHTLAGRAIIVGGSQVATPSTPLIFNNQSGVIATLTNTNGTDAASAINPGTGLQWIGGGVTVNLIGVSYVSGTTVSTVSCTIFGKSPVVTLTNGIGSVAWTEGSSAWSGTNSSLTNYLSPGAETIACPSATLSNGQPMPAPSGSTLLNFGPFPGQQANAAMPALQVVRLDNTAPGATSANGVVQTAITIAAMTSPWVNSSTSLAPAATGSGNNALGLPSLATLNAATGGTDIEEGVDNITVTVYAPAAGVALPGNANSCTFTGLTAVTTGSQLTETTVSTAFAARIAFKDALGNQVCKDLAAPFGADFVAPTIVSVTAPAANSFFNLQANVTDFSFSVTDNASGFGAEPVIVQMVRLDSANTALCILGTGSSCTATDTTLTFDATKSLTNSGYYTVTYSVRDQAGNATTATTITYLLDQVAPTWTGGVSLPSVIAGATTNTFTATPSDNLDLAAVFGVVDYPTIDIRYPSQSLGTYGAPLEKGGTAVGYAVANWMRCVNVAGDFATTTNNPALITLTAEDQAGNAGTVASPGFGANAQACGAVGAVTPTAFGPTIATLPATKIAVDRDGVNMLNTSSTTVTLSDTATVPINTSADPFARVDFYYQIAPGVFRFAGSATGVLAQTPSTRTYTYTFTWDPDANVPTGSVNVIGIGVDAQGDAVLTVAAAVPIVP